MPVKKVIKSILGNTDSKKSPKKSAKKVSRNKNKGKASAEDETIKPSLVIANTDNANTDNDFEPETQLGEPDTQVLTEMDDQLIDSILELDDNINVEFDDDDTNLEANATIILDVGDDIRLDVSDDIILDVGDDIRLDVGDDIALDDSQDVFDIPDIGNNEHDTSDIDTPEDSLTGESEETGESEGSETYSSKDTLNTLGNVLAGLKATKPEVSDDEQLGAQSLRWVSDLIDYTHETEATFATLESLKPENEQLTEKLKSTRLDLEDQISKADTFESELDTLKSENEKLTEQLNSTRGDLEEQISKTELFESKANTFETRFLESEETLETTQESLSELESLRDQLSSEFDAIKSSLEIEVNEKKALKLNVLQTHKAHDIDKQALTQLASKNANLDIALNVSVSEKLNTEKEVETLEARLKTTAEERDNLSKIVTQTIDKNTEIGQLNQSLKAQLESSASDFTALKREFDDTLLSKDAEIEKLLALINIQKSEITAKHNILSTTNKEMNQMRERYETTKHMRTKLLKYIEVQRSETLELGEKFTQVNSRYGELSENQAGYQKDYDTLLRVVDMQAEKIRRYMSDNFAPAQTFPALSINELEDNSSETS